MKPAAFDYVAPRSLDEAVEALSNGGADAKLLAGGQSLIPLLNFRLARPSRRAASSGRVCGRAAEYRGTARSTDSRRATLLSGLSDNGPRARRDPRGGLAAAAGAQDRAGLARVRPSPRRFCISRRRRLF